MSKKQIQIGSEVVVSFKNGFLETYSLTYAEQANIANGKISPESPFGQAIMGRQENQAISYLGPLGQKICCKIIKVS